MQTWKVIANIVGRWMIYIILNMHASRIDFIHQFGFCIHFISESPPLKINDNFPLGKEGFTFSFFSSTHNCSVIKQEKGLDLIFSWATYHFYFLARKWHFQEMNRWLKKKSVNQVVIGQFDIITFHVIKSDSM